MSISHIHHLPPLDYALHYLEKLSYSHPVRARVFALALPIFEAYKTCQLGVSTFLLTGKTFINFISYVYNNPIKVLLRTIQICQIAFLSLMDFSKVLIPLSLLIYSSNCLTHMLQGFDPLPIQDLILLLRTVYTWSAIIVLTLICLPEGGKPTNNALSRFFTTVTAGITTFASPIMGLINPKLNRELHEKLSLIYPKPTDLDKIHELIKNEDSNLILGHSSHIKEFFGKISKWGSIFLIHPILISSLNNKELAAVCHTGVKLEGSPTPLPVTMSISALSQTHCLNLFPSLQYIATQRREALIHDRFSNSQIKLIYCIFHHMRDFSSKSTTALSNHMFTYPVNNSTTMPSNFVSFYPIKSLKHSSTTQGKLFYENSYALLLEIFKPYPFICDTCKELFQKNPQATLGDLITALKADIKKFAQSEKAAEGALLLDDEHLLNQVATHNPKEFIEGLTPLMALYPQIREMRNKSIFPFSIKKFYDVRIVYTPTL